MTDETKQTHFEGITTEGALRLKAEMDALLNKDWVDELKANGFPDQNLHNADASMHAFCRGVIDVIHDQLKRRLVSTTYRVPQVIFTQISSFAQYTIDTHTLAINRDLLELLSQYPQSEPMKAWAGNDPTQIIFEGSVEEYISDGERGSKALCRLYCREDCGTCSIGEYSHD